MKKFFLYTILSFTVSVSANAQGQRKLSKNFSFVITGKLDTVSTFSISQRTKRSGWGEFSGAMTQSLISNGFTVVNKNINSTHGILIIVDYGRGFFAGKMQYFDLRVQLFNQVDNSEVIGTFNYDGRFNPDDIADAITAELKKKNLTIIKEEQKQVVIKDESSVKNEVKPIVHNSKEEKLIELKTLFDKGLITKEEYDQARKKIIEN